jgi:GNAT superfamily N-acetyltransferase
MGFAYEMGKQAARADGTDSEDLAKILAELQYVESKGYTTGLKRKHHPRYPVFKTRAVTPDGDEVGCAQVIPSEWRPHKKDIPEWYIQAVQVKPEFQGKGVASELLRRVVDKYKDKQMGLRAHPYGSKTLSREQLMKFYSKFGFIPTGKRGIRMPEFDTEEDGKAYRRGTGPGAMTRLPDEVEDTDAV